MPSAPGIGSSAVGTYGTATILCTPATLVKACSIFPQVPDKVSVSLLNLAARDPHQIRQDCSFGGAAIFASPDTPAGRAAAACAVVVPRRLEACARWLELCMFGRG